MSRREENISIANEVTFDVAIIGGGINGASLFDRLSRMGYRTVLLDKGDFSGGSSQASAMMIWGGLLYLRNMDIASVLGFSRSRDQMIRSLSDWISPCRFRFLPAQKGLLSKLPILSAMYFYWLLGKCNRTRPRVETCFPEKNCIAQPCDSLLFEEGMLRCSDSRFVLRMLTDKRPPDHVALNYCALQEGEYHRGENRWHLAAQDRPGGRSLRIRARMVVNCAGVWTDSINELFGIQSPFKHVFSKGVFIGFRRPTEQQMPLIFAQSEHNDVILSIPWGPVVLWGPTEQAVTEIDKGFTVTREDVNYLLQSYEQNMVAVPAKNDIISLRCGIRPLAVKNDYHGNLYTLDHSRSFRVASDPEVPWISVYGGKITGCDHTARSVAGKVATRIAPRTDQLRQVNVHPGGDAVIPTTSFPGLEVPVPSLEWCMEKEFCCSLEDYLRRRTNIAQWTPREGLGHGDQYREHLRSLCLVLTGGDSSRADEMLAKYAARVEKYFDRILEHL